MKFLNIFRKEKPKGTAGEILFYHEDDFCQVELSPRENISLFHSEAQIINNKAEKSFDNFCYTDIHVRNDDLKKLSERKIDPSELEQILQTTEVKKASSVITGYGSNYRELCENTFGYGEGYSAIYFDVKAGVVEHIWMTGLFGIEKEKLIECLFEIGERWNLILMDWNQTTAIDISNKNEVSAYLT